MKPNLSMCADCGMAVSPGEYHPFAACLMFKACHDGDTVRANLDAVRGHSAQQGAAKCKCSFRIKMTGDGCRYCNAQEYIDRLHDQIEEMDKEQDADKVDAQPTTYASRQATNCAGCGEHKHTPLRIDAMGGYVCLTCIDHKLSSLLGEFGYPEAAQPSDELLETVIENAEGRWNEDEFRIHGPDLLNMLRDCYRAALNTGPAMAGDDRAAFEGFVREQNYLADDVEIGKFPDGDYTSPTRQKLWEYWQAAGKRVQPASGEDAESNARLNRIAWLIGSAFVHGGFKAETHNERELEALLRANGTFWETLTDFDAAMQQGGQS